MRLSFANGEHADVVVEDTIILGSAEGSALVLPAREVAARHVRLNVGARGIVLEVLEPGARTHVNARPVRERALLHLGDIVCLGRIAITLKADRDDSIEAPPPVTQAGPAQAPAAVTLRGVAGSHFGRALAINPRLTVGRGRDCALRIDEPQVARQHAVVEAAGQSIYLRGGGEGRSLRVNGIPVADAVIYPGDQITIGRSQFLVEAPGWPRRGEAGRIAGHAITDAVRALEAPPAAPVAARHRGLWWLIGVAALIALISVLLIERGL
ncbi:FHA domain-containing protein [Dokdonella sp.]|uniref:FHA domain-containing protein n=1 Tax=Dokdonella sp. TaxID=2291710 RepID=UPI0031CB6027|nr:FHA domain-containing protein [Dokdonella sp.]